MGELKQITGGSEKQVAWAEKIRAEIVGELRAQLAESKEALESADGIAPYTLGVGPVANHLVADGESIGKLKAHFNIVVFHPVRIGALTAQTNARWWIDYRQELHTRANNHASVVAARAQYATFHADNWDRIKAEHAGDRLAAIRALVAEYKAFRVAAKTAVTA